MANHADTTPANAPRSRACRAGGGGVSPSGGLRTLVATRATAARSRSILRTRAPRSPGRACACGPGVLRIRHVIRIDPAVLSPRDRGSPAPASDFASRAATARACVWIGHGWSIQATWAIKRLRTAGTSASRWRSRQSKGKMPMTCSGIVRTAMGRVKPTQGINSANAGNAARRVGRPSAVRTRSVNICYTNKH